LAKQLDAFGADLGTSDQVIESYKSNEVQTFHEVQGKNWPIAFRKQLSADVDPCMLVIAQDFDRFDPSNDPWAAVWFSQLAAYAQDLPRLFHKLAVLSRSGEDVFGYLKRLTLKATAKKAA
jgi:hypothetical protein